MKNDSNDLYRQRPDPQLLFGRGYRAGIDVREQRKRGEESQEATEPAYKNRKPCVLARLPLLPAAHINRQAALPNINVDAALDARSQLPVSDAPPDTPLDM